MRTNKEGDIMNSSDKKCPVCHIVMTVSEMEKAINFRGVDVSYKYNAFVCPKCELEVGTLDQAATVQRKMSEAYRKKIGLLTGEEIKKYRKKYGLTQKALADKITVGIASIKRWEGGIIQSKSMDKVLHNAFFNSEREYQFSGNRKFSIPRVKLVIRFFESILNIILLKKNDKMLYVAKYLWYGDFCAYRDIEKSITGATYAALPLGPQLNNYRDLINEIQKSDEAQAEPLTGEEKRILNNIAKAFPECRMVYKAAHREVIWKNKTIGTIIPYSDAAELTEL